MEVCGRCGTPWPELPDGRTKELMDKLIGGDTLSTTELLRLSKGMTSVSNTKKQYCILCKNIFQLVLNWSHFPYAVFD